MITQKESDRIDAILVRGIDANEDIAYMSIGRMLIIVPKDTSQPIVRYKLERV